MTVYAGAVSKMAIADPNSFYHSSSTGYIKISLTDNRTCKKCKKAKIRYINEFYLASDRLCWSCKE